MSKQRLLLATTNKGKAKEIKSYLRELPLEIFSLEEAGLKESFPERGKSFAENARGKSLFYSKSWEGLTLAEDSGLEIDYLKGAPGVLSARFSAPQATDDKNNQKVLELLRAVPIKQRTARFVSYLVLARAGEIIQEIEEYVEGLVAFEKRGSHGFGYDPLFYFPPLGKTFAELPPEEKNKVSHRGRALKELKKFLLQYLSPTAF